MFFKGYLKDQFWGQKKTREKVMLYDLRRESVSVGSLSKAVSAKLTHRNCSFLIAFP